MHLKTWVGCKEWGKAFWVGEASPPTQRFKNIAPAPCFDPALSLALLFTCRQTHTLWPCLLCLSPVPPLKEQRHLFVLPVDESSRLWWPISTQVQMTPLCDLSCQKSFFFNENLAFLSLFYCSLVYVDLGLTSINKTNNNNITMMRLFLMFSHRCWVCIPARTVQKPKGRSRGSLTWKTLISIIVFNPSDMHEFTHTCTLKRPVQDAWCHHDNIVSHQYVDNKTWKYICLLKTNPMKRQKPDIVSAFFPLLFTGAGLWLQSISLTN